MFVFLFAMFTSIGFADEPDLTITVEDKAYEEIYVEPARIICDSECPEKDWIDTAVFIEAARKHRSWFKAGKIGAVYNSETIGLVFDDCDFEASSLVCGKKNGVWILRTIVVRTENKASIQLILFDESGNIIGQGTQEQITETTIVERRKITQSSGPDQPVGITRICEKNQPGCIVAPVNNPGGSTYTAEDLEPSVITQAPVLRERHVGQAMIGVYAGILK